MLNINGPYIMYHLEGKGASCLADSERATKLGFRDQGLGFRVPPHYIILIEPYKELY